jgi:hypothetical protein
MAKRVENVGAEIDPQHLAQPTLAFLKTYWDGKRGDRAMPRRADIDPLEMKEHLGWIILADVMPDLADFRYRVVGTRVTQYFGRDITGKLLSEMYEPFGQPALKMALAVYRKVARERIVLRTFGKAGWLEDDFIDFDQLFLPLSEDGVNATMIMSAFTYDPRRLRRAHGSL